MSKGIMGISTDHFDRCVYCEKPFTKDFYPKIEFSTFLGNNEIQDNRFCSVSCYDDFRKAKQMIYKIVYEALKNYQNKTKRISGDSNEI